MTGHEPVTQQPRAYDCGHAYQAHRGGRKTPPGGMAPAIEGSGQDRQRRQQQAGRANQHHRPGQ